MNKKTSDIERACQLELLCSGSQDGWYFDSVPIASNLKRLRNQRGLSQPKLAALSGVSQQLISQIENGKNATTKVLPALARALGVHVADIDPAFRETQSDASDRLLAEFAEFSPGKQAEFLALAAEMVAQRHRGDGS